MKIFAFGARSIRMNYVTLNEKGQFVSKKSYNLCRGTAKTVSEYNNLLENMRQNYFRYDMSSTPISEMNYLSLILLIGDPQDSPDQKISNMIKCMQDIISDYRKENPKANLAELLLSMKIDCVK